MLPLLALRCCSLSLRAYSHPASIADRRTDTQVLVRDDEDAVCVAVRGTSSLRDVAVDLSFAGEDFEGRGEVHRGFAACALAVRGRRDVLLTGHSLGAAVSTLLAADLAREFPGKRIRLLTFGSPRVGSPEFARSFRASVPDAHRYHLRLDPVTWMPGFMGFEHVGQPRSLAGLGHSLHTYQGALQRALRPGDAPSLLTRWGRRRI